MWDCINAQQRKLARAGWLSKTPSRLTVPAHSQTAANAGSLGLQLQKAPQRRTRRWWTESRANRSRESGGRPHFGILFPLTRACARVRGGEHPATTGRSAAGELVSEAKSRSLQGFNVKTGPRSGAARLKRRSAPSFLNRCVSHFYGAAAPWPRRRSLGFCARHEASIAAKPLLPGHLLTLQQ